MSFTYGGAASSPISAVRFTIGDTTEATARLMDEDIAYLLSETGGDINQAARLAVEAIIATLSSLCDQSVGSVSKSYSQMRAGWMATLAIIKDRSVYRGGAPLVGGISRTAERIADRDKERIAPQFTSRMLQHHRRADGHGLLGAPCIEGGRLDAGIDPVAG